MIYIDKKIHIISVIPGDSIEPQKFADLMIGTAELLRDNHMHLDSHEHLSDLTIRINNIAHTVKQRIYNLGNDNPKKDQYSLLIHNRKILVNMLVYTCRQLREKHLPVYFLDFNYFNLKFSKLSTLRDKKYNNECNELAIQYYQALNECVQLNYNNAKLYNISIGKPQ